MTDEITPQPDDEMSGMESSSGSLRDLFQVWIKALTQPSVEAYQEIAFSASDSTGRDYGAVFVAALIQAILGVVLGFVFQAVFGGSFFEGIEGISDVAPSIGGSIIGLVCTVPFTSVFYTLGFAANTAITHGLAKMMGSEGLHEHLLHARASYVAPVLLITGLLMFIPIVNFSILLISLYVLMLNVIAVKAVYQNEWWQAAVAGLGTAVLWICMWVVCVGGFIALIFGIAAQNGF